MRDLRLLLLGSVGVVSAMAAGACATEAQEPGLTAVGPATGDLGTETSTSAGGGANANANTEVAAITSGPVTTTINTAASSDDDSSTETATTMPFPLGGTFNTTGSSTTSGAATTGNAAAASASSATSSGEAASGNGGMGGATSAGGFNNNNFNNNNGNTTGGTCTATPATAPVTIEANDGWVDCSTNDIGIQGEFFTYDDGAGSTITPGFTGDEICVDGTAAQGGDSTIWGAGFGVNLNQDEPEGDVNPWDADAMGISGFRFNLSAMPSGTGLRLVYQSGGTDYCVEVTASGPQTVLFSNTAEACWGSGGDAPNPSTLEAVKWQITTNSSGDHDFSFCITQLAAVP